MSTRQNKTHSAAGGSSGPSSNEVNAVLKCMPRFVHILTYMPSVPPFKAPDVICPICEKSSRRKQELHRHIQSFHLPRWIWCPYSACNWRGCRVDDFGKHLDKEKCGPMPEEREYQIYNVKMALDWIKEDSESANSILTAQSFAVDLVKERAKELGKKEWLEKPWGPGFQEQ